MKILPYGRQSVDAADIREVVRVLKSAWLTQGPNVDEFEQALCRQTGARYCVAVSSGTAALHLACLAAGIQKGDEVITSPISFVATANCILYCGGRPVFADVEPETINVHPEAVAKKITKKTKAIIPVHFAGTPVDMAQIQRLSKKHKCVVIEDACHALGAEYRHNGRWVKVGACRHSDMAVFSFHPVKSITTAEGGAIMTSRRDLYEKLRQLRTHGITKDARKLSSKAKTDGDWYYELQSLGYNYRISDVQCALGLSQLKKLDRWVIKRRQLVSRYVRKLNDVSEVSFLTIKEQMRSAHHLFVIRLKGATAKERMRVFDALRKKGIGVQVHYIPIHLQPLYRKDFGYKKGDFPFAEQYYQETISLPLYPAMTSTDVDHVVRTLKGLL